MSLWSKLNLKDQTSVVVLDAPEDVLEMLAPPPGVTRSTSVTGKSPIAFALAFVMDEPGVERTLSKLQPRLVEDAVLWFVYPKKTSKRYASAINRDTGWSALGGAGYEPVRMVAMDVDWSALRFRKAERITKLTRSASMILSEEGRKRVAARSKGKP